MKEKDDLRIYKLAALIGTIIMGIGSFMACLSETTSVAMVGNVLLIVSIIIMFWGYHKWQP